MKAPATLCLMVAILAGCAEPDIDAPSGALENPDLVEVVWRSWTTSFTTDLSNRAQVGGVDVPTNRLNDTDVCAIIDVEGLEVSQMDVAANASTDQRVRVVQFFKDDSGGPEFFADQNGESPVALTQRFEPPIQRDNAYAALTVANDTMASVGMRDLAEVTVTLLVSGEGSPRLRGTFNCESMFPGDPFG